MTGTPRPLLTIDGVTVYESRLINHFFHDFKGELSTVIMCLQSLRDGLVGDPPTAAQAHWLARAVANAQHMVQLINDFRDLTQLEEGVFPATPEDVPLGPRLQQLLEVARVSAGERSLRVEVRLPELPTATFATTLFDRLVSAVLMVAITNARGGTVVAVDAAVASAEGGSELTLTVSFEGVTFPPERLASVFDKLAQTREGLQLGRGYTLLFCRQAARTLGGDLLLRPWEARGNELVIRLPLRGGAA